MRRSWMSPEFQVESSTSSTVWNASSWKDTSPSQAGPAPRSANYKGMIHPRCHFCVQAANQQWTASIELIRDQPIGGCANCPTNAESYVRISWLQRLCPVHLHKSLTLLAHVHVQLPPKQMMLACPTTIFCASTMPIFLSSSYTSAVLWRCFYLWRLIVSDSPKCTPVPDGRHVSPPHQSCEPCDDEQHQ